MPHTIKYAIKPGDTLFAIATTNNISLNELLALNPQISDPSKIAVGQEITLPASQATSGDSPLNIPITLAEYQLNPANYQVFTHPLLKQITVTGGFMEPHGHSQKSTMRAIFADKQIKTLPPSRRNIGIDYVVAGKEAIAWYGGVVTQQGVERGYGRRVHIKLNLKYEHVGKLYEVFQAYAHLQECWVKVGQPIAQGAQIGVMGGSSHTSDRAYPLHIDLSTCIFIAGESVQVNPQLLDGCI